ncbi:MAG TPA: hypothetical protein VJJ52_02460 [Candidatus Nanoarchaeia archaeon]|nr:hypothetical protein [Candidatus Nanoarchaeia archaeon]
MIENVYVTLSLIVILMFLDYFLTIKSVKLAEQGYTKCIKLETLELNPNFRNNVDKKKYSWKHFLGVIFTTIIIYLFHYLGKNNIIFSMNTYFMFEAMLFSIFIFINSSHIRNLIVFDAVIKDKSLLTGKLRQKHLFSLKSTMADAFKVFIILMFLFLFVPSYFTFGFALGPLLLVFKNISWTKKYLKEKQKR